jgi:hypothetical protein
MTACFGYHTYLDLIQTYSIPDKRGYPPKEPKYSVDTIMGLLTNHEEYSIFKFLVKTAQMDRQMDQENFRSTLFVCNDENLKKKYPEEFFMKLDRDSARTLLNYNILNIQMNLRSLLTRRESKLDTKNPRSQLNVASNGKVLSINNQAYVLEEISRSNGTVFITDNLLTPEGFVQNCC